MEKFTEHPVAPNVVTQGGSVVRFCIAAILFLSAGLKAEQLATAPVLDEGILHARWFNILVVDFELFFGIWLLYGLLPQWTNRAATGLFCSFAMVSFYEAVSGEASCGCFGNVTVNPWITMSFDIIIVLFLLFFPPPQKKYESGLTILAAWSTLLSWLVVVFPLTWAMLTYEPAVLDTNGQVVGGAKAVMLYPQDWVGEKFPLLAHAEVLADLTKGDWLVILYGKDCAECEKHFEEWKANGFSDSRNVALLEIAGHPTNALRSRFGDGTWHWGCLKRTNDWYIKTPAVMELKNGYITDVRFE